MIALLLRSGSLPDASASRPHRLRRSDILPIVRGCRVSWAFLPFYTGDYLRDTRHLTPLKHGVYVLLLFHCWDQRGPLPLDEQECSGIANCRSADEVEALRYILERFFTRMEDGWYNRRIQHEIERASAISIKRKYAGAKGYQARAKQLPSKRYASASTLTTTTTTTPTTTTSKTKAKGLAQAPFVLPDWIPLEHWQAWIEARTKTRHAPTDYAKRLAVIKLDNLREQGHEPAQVLMNAAFNGWSGLFPPKEIK